MKHLPRILFIALYSPFFALPLGTTGCGDTSETNIQGQQVTEKPLEIKLALAGSALTITVRDGQEPVLTDLWLFSIQENVLKPLAAFKEASSSRKSKRLMLPCTIAGTPSSLIPCDEGAENGFMTDTVREKMENASRVSAIDGEVTILLDVAPTAPVAVVAGIEDQRYAGAAAIDPSGATVIVPGDRGTPKTYRKRTYDSDVAPLLATLQCPVCHASAGAAEPFPLHNYESLVAFDFAFAEEKERCRQEFPADESGRFQCEQAITSVEYMVELGSPALSPFARRTRPDEMQSVSPEGLKWYGSKGERFASKGDRRMPPQNITPEAEDDLPMVSHFDTSPADYQIIFDWVAQGAPRN